mmetsp:Transcript_78565/g.188481  ORF Transcript_78565/g.188481 Transcript_78565/m.188481 type:complete len:225 (+) Transcript_78565:1039-1713(+)
MRMSKQCYLGRDVGDRPPGNPHEAPNRSRRSSLDGQIAHDGRVELADSVVTQGLLDQWQVGLHAGRHTNNAGPSLVLGEVLSKAGCPGVDISTSPNHKSIQLQPPAGAGTRLQLATQLCDVLGLALTQQVAASLVPVRSQQLLGELEGVAVDKPSEAHGDANHGATPDLQIVKEAHEDIVHARSRSPNQHDADALVKSTQVEFVQQGRDGFLRRGRHRICLRRA